MSRRIFALAALFALLQATACARSPVPTTPPQDLAGETDLAGRRDMAFGAGRCFGKGPGISCSVESPNCGAPFVTCQEGKCCSGIIDPETCVCHCNGGPPCDRGTELCCVGGMNRNLADQGVLRCRWADDCFDRRP